MEMSLSPPPPPGDVLALKGRNVDEWWFLANDPSADDPIADALPMGTGGGATGSKSQQEPTSSCAIPK